MASSSTEDENYWPGYVDALTTMVMVLTFIMMVLGITIFVLSQNASRAFVEGIADAAGIEATGTEPMEELKQQIVGLLKAQSRGELSMKGVAVPPPSPERLPDARDHTNSGTAIALGTQPKPMAFAQPGTISERAAAGDGPAAASPLDPGAPIGDIAKRIAGPRPDQQAPPVLADPALEPKPASPGSAMMPESSANVTQKEIIGPSVAKATPAPFEQRLESSLIDEKQEPGKSAISAAGPLITIRYAERSTRLDEAATAQLRKFLASPALRASTGNLLIKAYSVSTGGVTEARRAAYFRAMLIRQVLSSTAIEPGRISVRIEDAVDPAQINTVQVFGQAPAVSQ